MPRTSAEPSYRRTLHGGDDIGRLPHTGPRHAERLRRGLGRDLIALMDVRPGRVLGTLRLLGRTQAREAAAYWRALRIDDRERRLPHGVRAGRDAEPR